MMNRSQLSPSRRSRKAYTLVEMLVVFFVTAITLGIIYEMYIGATLRALGVIRRVEGEGAVRVLLARMRQELRHAIRPVEISNFGTTSIAIPLMDPTGSEEDPQHPKRYFSRYTFDKDERQILYERIGGLTAEDGDVLARRIWMGGDTPIHSLTIEHTSDNERILFQYYRVILKISFFDHKIKNQGRRADSGSEPENLIHVSTTVYPRRINQELRIEVPQEGSLL